MFFNTPTNPADHIAVGIENGALYGLNPRSDTQFLKYKFNPFAKKTGVPGVVKPQVGGFLDRSARIPVTGMQAQMIQDAISRGIANPPNYPGLFAKPELAKAFLCYKHVDKTVFKAH
jgi:hypothetical protein